jgi:hypothetical protein
MNRSSEMRDGYSLSRLAPEPNLGLKQGVANTADYSECELRSDGASTMASYARLVKRTAEECHVPFHTLATDTKPLRRLVVATECLIDVSIRRSSNSSLARVKYPPPRPIGYMYLALAYTVLLRTLAGMSASSQGRFCIRSCSGYQRQRSCNPLLSRLPRQSASSDYASWNLRRPFLGSPL